MAHLLMIESWLLSTGMALPKAIRRLGHEYTLVCRFPERYGGFKLTDGAHPAAALARQVVQADTNDPVALLAAARERHAGLPVDGVVTSCGFHLKAVAELAETLGLPGASPESVITANRKDLMREAMQRAGLPGPAFRVADNLPALRKAAAELGFPLVIKPVDLCASQGVRRVDSLEDLHDAWAALDIFAVNAFGQFRHPSVLLESLLLGEEFSVETVTFAGQTRVVGITDKSLSAAPGFVETGHMFPAILAPEDARETERLVREALRAVGYRHGVAHTEVRLTADGPRVVEINTRVAGNWISDLVRHVTGDDLLEAVVALSLGEDWRPATVPDGRRSAAIHLAIPERDGVISAVSGWEDWDDAPDLVSWLLRPELVGMEVTRARDNSQYLAYVICLDPAGTGARRMAEARIRGLRFDYRPSEAGVEETS